ncbi:hypothetical protein ACU8OK_27050 (plasmid) [Rhizobium leguminosarum]
MNQDEWEKAIEFFSLQAPSILGTSTVSTKNGC